MMSKKKKLIIIIISIVLVLLIGAGSAFFLLWFGEDSPAKRKKKQVVIIKQNPISSSQSSDGSDTKDDYMSDGAEDEEYEEYYDRIRRELYQKTQNSVVNYVPEYKVTAKKWNGPKGYVIVIKDGDKNSEKIAKLVQDYFKKYADIKLDIVTDKQKEQKKEILIGDTKRYTSKLKENEYAVKISGDKLIFEGGHSVMLEKAADWFVTEKYSEGKANTLTGKTKDFSAVKEGGYVYVWGDEFAGSDIDMSNWNFEDRISGTALEEKITDKSVANVKQDNLNLYSIRSYRKENPVAQYASNMSLTTMETMSFKYGYLEMSARVPYIRGSWPSFWLNSSGVLGESPTKPYGVEVDIFEIISSYDTATPNMHKWRGAGTHSDYSVVNRVNGKIVKPTTYVFKNSDNLINEYHIYGFKWTDKEMTMSIDGEDYMTFDLTKDFDEEYMKSLGKTPDGMEGFKEPLGILLNNGMFAPDTPLWGGASTVTNTDLPFEYNIDWIRLYQIPGEGKLNLAD